MTKLNILKNPDFKPSIYSGLYTVSKKMIHFMEQVARVSKTEASILVRGDSGTGKELVARFIHDQSRREGKTFSAINCAALSRELMASELFGHRKGAFTGAIHDRKGLLELTDGGTLFLDEIAEMPLDIQAGLLRVLQDHCYTPLGSSEIIHTNIRLVSATHESLRRKVGESTFREDLMYRVRVVPLYLPPLIERDQDVEMLSWLFLEELNKVNERTVTGIEQSALQKLIEYRWPGNVRELHNVIEYTHAIGEGETLLLSDLPPELLGEEPPDERNLDAVNVERDHILELLRLHNGKKQVVADKLGVSRATLWRKMKTLQI